jgi:hypothetical protein
VSRTFAANSASAPPMSPRLKNVAFDISSQARLAFELAVHVAKARTPSQGGF